jgi:hypothetical protein
MKVGGKMSGVLLSIGNTLATLPGVLAPVLTGPSLPPSERTCIASKACQQVVKSLSTLCLKLLVYAALSYECMRP